MSYKDDDRLILVEVFILAEKRYYQKITEPANGFVVLKPCPIFDVAHLCTILFEHCFKEYTSANYEISIKPTTGRRLLLNYRDNNLFRSILKICFPILFLQIHALFNDFFGLVCVQCR